MIKPWHIIVVAIVVLVLFGAKRLPDGARAIGRSLRIFKAETKGLMEDDVKGKAEAKSSAEVKPEQPAAEDGPTPLTGDVIDPAPKSDKKR